MATGRAGVRAHASARSIAEITPSEVGVRVVMNVTCPRQCERQPMR